MVRPRSGPANKGSWQGAPKDEEHAMSAKCNSEIAVIGIDVGKNSFHIAGLPGHLLDHLIGCLLEPPGYPLGSRIIMKFQ